MADSSGADDVSKTINESGWDRFKRKVGLVDDKPAKAGGDPDPESTALVNKLKEARKRGQQ
jgi:hypothetical protein